MRAGGLGWRVAETSPGARSIQPYDFHRLNWSETTEQVLLPPLWSNLRVQHYMLRMPLGPSCTSICSASYGRMQVGRLGPPVQEGPLRRKGICFDPVRKRLPPAKAPSLPFHK